MDMMALMGSGEGFGKMLQEGGYRIAEKYGHPELFIGSKKQAFAAYDPRGAVGMGLGYATSNRGACHLRGYSISLEHFGNPVKLDPFTTEQKEAFAKVMGLATADEVRDLKRTIASLERDLASLRRQLQNQK